MIGTDEHRAIALQIRFTSEMILRCNQTYDCCSSRYIIIQHVVDWSVEA